MEIGEQAVFRVARDADFEVSDEADDLLEAVELEVRRRRFGEVVRLEVSSADVALDARPARRRASTRSSSQVYPVDGMLDLADLMEIATHRPARAQ